MGTTPGGNEVVDAKSFIDPSAPLTDGLRKLPRPGLVQTTTGWTLTGLTPGRMEGHRNGSWTR